MTQEEANGMAEYLTQVIERYVKSEVAEAVKPKSGLPLVSPKSKTRASREAREALRAALAQMLTGPKSQQPPQE